MQAKDFGYSYDYYGYMIYYKKQPIGGAGTIRKEGRRNKADLAHYKHLAEVTIRDILDGRIAPFMLKEIEKIDSKFTKNPFRWTREDLNKVTLYRLMTGLIAERRETLTNIYSPLSRRLQHLQVWLDHNQSKLDFVPSEFRRV